VARISKSKNSFADSEPDKALLKKAGALLSRRGYSRGELRNKLLKFAGNQQVESVLDRLEQLKLLNDTEYAYNFALYRIERQSWGSAKVHDDLRRRHVAPSIIEYVLQRVRNELGEETIPLEYIRKYCGKHWPPAEKKHLQRLIMHLRGRGFSDEAIEHALRKLPATPALQHFEMGE
jgi:regulatory protein